MRHFDLTPLYRSTIGFDRLGALLDTLGAFDGEVPSYPPYNIERVGENEYRISMAVAGFGEKDLSIEVKEGDDVPQGQALAKVGNSGNTSEPHLHIHLQDTPRAHVGEGIPLYFHHYRTGGRMVERGMPTGGFSLDGPTGQVVEHVQPP